MKLKARVGIIAVIFAALCATATLSSVMSFDAHAATDDASITCQKAEAFGADYLAVYQIPTSMFSYETNGGGTIANAFDGNWNSSWISAKDNVGGHYNRIAVTFDREVSVDRFVYVSDSTRSGYGYPTRLKIYYAVDGGETTLYGECASGATADRVVFKLSEPVTATAIVFEFAAVNTAHKYVASAKELLFLQPENESANAVLDLFEDYTQHTVKPEYIQRLGQLREQLVNSVNYESALKPLLDRADTVAAGEVHRDDRFEFSTNPNARNVITRRGNLIGYAKDVLKINVYGYTTNRQPTGIGGLCGEAISVYVDAPNPKDPLPSIFVTQASGDWHNWKATYSLVRGRNVFTVPQFIVEANGVGGGPIYIVNPYTEGQQSTDVKIYIEGGFLFPTYRAGDDEDAFKAQLKEYEENRLNDPSAVVDVCEIVGDHFINTTKSSYAYNHYIVGTVSPKANVDNWTKYMTGLLAFDGVSIDPDDEHFDARNLYLPVNFRLAHWSGYAAYSMGEHVGLVSLGHASLTNLVAPGWGLSHEVGHMMDLGERSKAETTNNMWSVYGSILMNNTINTDKAQHIVSPAALYPDETATEYNYYHKNGYSISQWWNLEAAKPGFWGRLDNLYRYYDRNAAFVAAGVTAKAEQELLTKTEKTVYFSSLAMGVDLGYYYERYGFAFESTPFTVANASSAYKKLVAKAIEDGVLSTEQYKYWYFDINQYFHDVNERACYDASTAVEIRAVWKNNDRYTLVMPEPADAERHLGYEIKEYRGGNWYVIGFTRTASFVDTAAYPDGYTPVYKVCAYDRQLNCSADSAEARFSELKQSRVCRINDTYYDSLAEAVAAANAGDTVYLCADTRESGFTVDKNLTILPDPALTGDVVVTRRATGALISVSAGTVTMGKSGADVNARIILDGFSFNQTGPLISIGSAVLNMNNIVLRNNFSTADGGAISSTQAGSPVRLTANRCEFIGNGGRNGGAIYNASRAVLNDCTVTDNYATNNGGAVANFSGGVMTLNNCVVDGNRAGNSGGGFALDGSTVLNNTAVTNNTAASLGGGLYIAISKSNRTVAINGGAASGNAAQKGGAVYLHAGALYLGGAEGIALSGEIYKYGGTIGLRTAAIDFSDAVFRLPAVEGNTVLLTADGNVTLTVAMTETVRVYLGAARLDETGKNVLTDSAVAEITLNVNGRTETIEHTAGWSYTLPISEDIDIPDGKRLVGWEVGGVRYNAGERITVREAVGINAVLEDIPVEPTDDPDKPNEPAVTDPDKPKEEVPEKRGNVVGIVVGIAAGVVAVAAGAFVAWYFAIKKKKATSRKK